MPIAVWARYDQGTHLDLVLVWVNCVEQDTMVVNKTIKVRCCVTTLTHVILYFVCLLWCGGLMVRELASESSGPWARHLTLTVPLSTQVYKWVPANLMLGVTLPWTSIIPSRGI